MFTTTSSPKVRNTLLVTGAAEARYDKLHLFDALGYAESRQIEAGATPVTFPLAGHRIGLATCYDVRFPNPVSYTHLDVYKRQVRQGGPSLQPRLVHDARRRDRV